MLKARLVGKGRRINAKAREAILDVEQNLGRESKSSTYPRSVGRERGRGIGWFAVEDIADEGFNEFSWVDTIEFAGFDDGEDHGHRVGTPF